MVFDASFLARWLNFRLAAFPYLEFQRAFLHLSVLHSSLIQSTPRASYLLPPLLPRGFSPVVNTNFRLVMNSSLRYALMQRAGDAKRVLR